MSYIHSDLSQVRTDGYRHFYGHESAGRSLALARTSFKAGELNEVVFNLLTATPVEKVDVELRSEAGDFVDSTTTSIQNATGRAVLRFGAPGLYRITVRLPQGDGQRRASESVQVSANILPQSLVIIGAHPDHDFRLVSGKTNMPPAHGPWLLPRQRTGVACRGMELVGGWKLRKTGPYAAKERP